MGHLLQGYQLCATTEGKSPNAIAIVTNSVNYFQDFLTSQSMSTQVIQISQHEIRAFTLRLQQKRCFSNHRFNHVQDRGLSGYTINCYLRSLRIFFSWLVSEEIIEANPFDRVKIPRPPRKIIPTFSDSQIRELLSAIDTTATEGYRDYAIILTLLDTGLRVSELCSLKLDNLWLEDGMLKVLGKGNKERLIPVGKQVQRLLWHYINRCRPEPFVPNGDLFFLTREGKPLTKDRVGEDYDLLRWKGWTEGSQVPEDIRVESLSDYQMGELNRLKSWLYQQRVKARQEKVWQHRKRLNSRRCSTSRIT